MWQSPIIWLIGRFGFVRKGQEQGMGSFLWSLTVSLIPVNLTLWLKKEKSKTWLCSCIHQ